MFVCLLLAGLVVALTPWQTRTAKEIMNYRNVPQWSAVIDAALHGEVAFTDVPNSKVYIDGRALLSTPNTWLNVLVHECGHLLGAQHQDGSLGMQYVVTEYPNGSITNDNFLLVNLGLPPPNCMSEVCLARP